MNPVTLIVIVFVGLLISTVLCNCSDSGDADRDHLQCLKKQVIESGGEINKMDVHEYSPGNNGMVAQEDIQIGDLICYIPQKMIVTKEVSEQTEIVKHLYSIGVIKPENYVYDTLLLQLMIMEERRNPDSKLKDFIGMIPNDWTNFPLLYTEEDMQCLKGSALTEWTIVDRKTKRAQYEFISQYVPDFKSKYTFAEFLETSKAVASRTFSFALNKKNEDDQTIIMVPFGDLFNHRNPPDLDWSCETDKTGRQGWFARAIKKVSKGEQVFISYGNKSNQYLLPVYGFFDADNQAGIEVFLKLELKDSDPFRNLKIAVLGTEQLTLNLKKDIDADTLSILRFALFNDANNGQQIQAIKNPTMVPTFSIKNEMNVWLHLKKMCQKNLEAYPRTL